MKRLTVGEWGGVALMLVTMALVWTSAYLKLGLGAAIFTAIVYVVLGAVVWDAFKRAKLGA